MRNNKRRPYNKNNGRNKKNYNPLRTQFDSNGPAGKIRGTAQQVMDKYTAAAREARVSGDRVRAEELLQYAEHYARMIVEYREANPQAEKEVVKSDDKPTTDEITGEETVEQAENKSTEPDGASIPLEAPVDKEDSSEVQEAS